MINPKINEEMNKTDNAEFLQTFDIIELNEIDMIFYYYILIKP